MDKCRRHSRGINSSDPITLFWNPILCWKSRCIFVRKSCCIFVGKSCQKSPCPPWMIVAPSFRDFLPQSQSSGDESTTMSERRNVQGEFCCHSSKDLIFLHKMDCFTKKSQVQILGHNIHQMNFVKNLKINSFAKFHEICAKNPASTWLVQIHTCSATAAPCTLQSFLKNFPQGTF